MRVIRWALAVGLAALAGTAVSAGTAKASVQWDVRTEWGDTNLQPGGTGQFIILVKNVGSTDAAGGVTLKNHLPPGVEMTEFYPREGWSCFGTQTVTCANNLANLSAVGKAPGAEEETIGGSTLAPVIFDVAVSAQASGTKKNFATISGGGGATVTHANSVSFSSAAPAFGVLAESFEQSDVYSEQLPSADLERQAGSHPYEFRVDFDMNLMHDVAGGDFGSSYTNPMGRIRTQETDLPRGLFGNPEATPKCEIDDFLQEGNSSFNSTGCPANTQVGYLQVTLSPGKDGNGFGVFSPFAFSRVAIYNVEPPRGTPVDLGFRVGGFVYGHIFARLDASRGYGITAVTPDISTGMAVRSVRATLWGVPADPAHDIYRARGPIGTNAKGEAVYPNDELKFGASFENAPLKPFFTLPMDCGVDNGPVSMRASDWASSAGFTPTIEADHDLNVTGCDDPRIRFEPEMSLQPTSRDASQPTGLDVHLEVPQRDQTMADQSELHNLYPDGNLHAVDTPPIKRVVVRFPEGMTISTSAAQGLGACTSAQIGIGNNNPVTCPDSSQYGTLTLHTPILPPDEPMKGFIYIARKGDNPFNNFLSMYFVIEDQERGLRLKLPGKIDLDPVTGQITATFDDLPQFPLSDMQLTFKSGVRAALINPSTCGTKQIEATFYSWHDPGTPVPSSSAYNVTQKADGSPCVSNLRERPFKAEMSVGTVNPNAGSYSPFVFRMTRSDDDQEISQIGVDLPAGLTSKIAGITQCSEAAIFASSVPSRTGTEELSNPSCPASSLMGSTEVGSGVGVPLSFFPGRIYLAGPYRGAPLSIVVITPAIAGPYDLGVISVRSGITVDPRTTAIKVLSDPFPQIFQGIPVRIRDIRLKLDRAETILNPTNCDSKSIDAHLTGAGGDVNSTADDTAADLSNRFQVANCSSLGFKPKFSFQLKGGTKRNDHPALRATVKMRPGDANLSRVAVTLPQSAFLDQSHIKTICTRVQFAAEQCPRGAIYGYGRAWTPLLDQPVEGPVYLRSSSNELPDLVMSLRGTVDVELVGRIDSAKGGALRSTFDFVPDQPVSKFVLSMPGGGKGLLVNSTDICKASSRARVLIDGQNGKTADQSPKVQNSCRQQTGKQKQRRAASSTGRAGR